MAMLKQKEAMRPMAKKAAVMEEKRQSEMESMFGGLKKSRAKKSTKAEAFDEGELDNFMNVEESV